MITSFTASKSKFDEKLSRSHKLSSVKSKNVTLCADAHVVRLDAENKVPAPRRAPLIAHSVQYQRGNAMVLLYRGPLLDPRYKSKDLTSARQAPSRRRRRAGIMPRSSPAVSLRRPRPSRPRPNRQSRLRLGPARPGSQ